MIFSLFNCFTVPITVAFQPESFETQPLVILNFIIDFFFLLDMIITFRTSYVNSLGVEEVRYHMIAQNYIKSTFIIDFLATVPWDSLLKLSPAYKEYLIDIKKNDGNEWVQILGVLKLGRVLRLNKIIQFLKSSDDIKAGLKIFKMILYLTTYLHCYACVWWLIVGKTEIWVSPLDQLFGTENFYRIYQKNIFQQYMVALHATVLTLLGSDVTPRDSLQTTLSSMGIFFGAIINANIFGELSLIFSSLNR